MGLCDGVVGENVNVNVNVNGSEGDPNEATTTSPRFFFFIAVAKVEATLHKRVRGTGIVGTGKQVAPI